MAEGSAQRGSQGPQTIGPGTKPGHVPVLMREVLAALDARPGDVVLDCTAGLGGHAEALARRVGPSGTVVLCDQDEGNLRRAAERLRAIDATERPGRIETLHASFAQAPRRLAEFVEVGGKGGGGGGGGGADVVLADLGFSSNQMDDPERGFSFMRNGPLDMRLNRAVGQAGEGGGGGGGGGGGITAAELVNTLPARELAEILRDLGEEPAAARIADKIVASRKVGPIQTTGQLADIVRSVIPRRPGAGGGGGIDPATRTFQALRIAVNDELGALGLLLESISRAAVLNVLRSREVARDQEARQGQSSWLAPGARIGIISFHSLEDRLVKQAFAKLVSEGHAELTPARSKPPIGPSDEEVRDNPRSRSAKLRAVRLQG